MIKDINFDNGETEHLQFIAVDHEYTRLSGEVIPSATEILNIISKPALTFGAASEAGKYFREKIIPCDKLADTNIKLPLFTLPLSDTGAPTSLDQFQKDMTQASSRKASEAADIGSEVHHYISRYIKQRLTKGQMNREEFDPKHPIVKKCFNSFKDWIRDNNVRFYSSEEMVYHPELKYAGTVDAVAEINEEFCVIDFKTSARVYPEHHLQCAAYAKAVELIYGREVDCTYVLRFDKKTGKYQEKRSDEVNENFLAFRGAFVVYQRLKNMKRKKRAKRT